VYIEIFFLTDDGDTDDTEMIFNKLILQNEASVIHIYNKMSGTNKHFLIFICL